MTVTTNSVLKPEDLNDTDESLLDVLQGGRVTPTYAAEEMSVSREYASDRLKRLTEHGHITKVAPGLYELASDPRDTRTESDCTGDGEVNELADVVEKQKREIQHLREQNVDREFVSETKLILSRIEDELQSEGGSRDRIKMLVEDAQTALDNALGEDH